MTPASRPRRAFVAGAALLCLGALAGCSSSSSASTSTAASPSVSSAPASSAPASSASDVCAQRAAVKADLDALTSTQVLKDGTNALRSRYQTLVTNSQQLREAAKVQFAAEATAAQASLDALSTAIADLKASPSVAQAAAIAPLLAEVKASMQSLLDAIQSAC
ncbi:MAG: hypothetical protein WCF12_07985 [Propionicimonas sp.]